MEHHHQFVIKVQLMKIIHLTEPDNTIVKKPYACDSRAAEPVATGAGALAAGGSEKHHHHHHDQQEKDQRQMLNRGKSPAKSLSPLKERLTTFFTDGLSAKARQVTNRRYIGSPNKNCSKSKEGDESCSEASPKKNKTPKNKKEE